METQLHGLTSAGVEKRLKKGGPDEVPEPGFSFWEAFLSKLRNLSVWILEAVLLLGLILGKGIQAGLVLLVLLSAAYNGATQKKKSRRVSNDISHELTPTVAVEHDGRWIKLNSKQLVVGDLINLKRGDVLAADVSLKDGKTTCDESSITGESAPASKQLNDTTYAGTTVVDGFGLAVITATGANSRSGKAINLINQSAAPGHLQQLLTGIIFYLCMLSLTLTVIIIIAAFMHGGGVHGVIQMLPFLAMMFIASIPVAIPSTFAISNSFEAKRLSKEGVLTSDLTGIQDAANLSLILLDEIDTITESKTAVSSLTNLNSLSDSEVLQFVETATGKRNTSVTDAAIIEYSEQKGLTSLTPGKFVPFTSDTGYSEAVVDGQDLKLGLFKQLSLIDTSASEKIKDIDFTAGRSVASLVDNKLATVFILQDEVRSDSKAALTELKKRDIRPAILTGDNQRTAAAVAKQASLTGNVISIHGFNEQADLDSLTGIADVLPEDELKMVEFFQEEGFIVGMTGDGVSNTPALKQTEVGTAVANAAGVAERSDKMVLLDDGLMPIVKILDAGHRVYQRMTTWSLTKLSRITELIMILTSGYLLSRYLLVALNAMVIYTIMNNMITMVIGTGNTRITYKPENWDIDRMAKVSMSLASDWILIGCLFVWFMNNRLGFMQGQVRTMVYVYYVLSAMLIILITRIKAYFWQSHPSRLVGTVQIIDVALTFVLALLGIAMTQISIISLGLVVTAFLVNAIIIDLIYRPIMKNRQF